MWRASPVLFSASVESVDVYVQPEPNSFLSVNHTRWVHMMPKSRVQRRKSPKWRVPMSECRVAVVAADCTCQSRPVKREPVRPSLKPTNDIAVHLQVFSSKLVCRLGRKKYGHLRNKPSWTCSLWPADTRSALGLTHPWWCWNDKLFRKRQSMRKNRGTTTGLKSSGFSNFEVAD